MLGFIYRGMPLVAAGLKYGGADKASLVDDPSALWHCGRACVIMCNLDVPSHWQLIAKKEEKGLRKA